jgi:hypothetical protein
MKLVPTFRYLEFSTTHSFKERVQVVYPHPNVSNSLHENGHVSEQYNTAIDVCREDHNLEGSFGKEWLGGK